MDRTQTEVILDEEGTTDILCTTDGIDIVGLLGDVSNIEELHTRDGLF